MKFLSFEIANFKGIKHIKFDLEKSISSDIYTLVGLNESGKTTILEAINLFNPRHTGLDALGVPGTFVDDFNSLIPINRRDNFNDKISIMVTFSLSDEDFNRIEEHAKQNTRFKSLKKVNTIRYWKHIVYENSLYKETLSRWDGFSGILKDDPTDNITVIREPNYDDDNLNLARFCWKLIPSILYFPNFLFDFPPRIYLEYDSKSKKDGFYFDLIQDILYSLENDTDVEKHLIERIKSDKTGDRRALDALVLKMGKKVSTVIFDEWNRIFKINLSDLKVVFKSGINENEKCFLEVEIEGQDGSYQVHERSLGFRWFFTFLLFTQFRPYRKDSPQNLVFMFDEPASNLHPNAQQRLLKSFENLKNCKIIYTTHSHNMINPYWLESAYIVQNEGLEIDDPNDYRLKPTDITIEPYRSFVVNHPHNTAYFKPILDVLDYAPSNLEFVDNAILVEGKNDFYTLTYFNDIVFKNKPLHLIPGNSSSSLDTLFSLYIGWGKLFVALLDSDKEGHKQKNRYIEKFGSLISNHIFTLEDIDSTWKNKELETLIDATERLDFQKTCYNDLATYHKTQFNRAMQENLIKKSSFQFGLQSRENLEKTINFLRQKLT